ncbi:energy transducer TonB [Sphingobacterium faecale]|uniref:Energy transducer TonB n=1 Tax=Sphingobacterium faecale TaxID=2803775 RepID=A0ABS1R9B0_9SPHI|nr:energy transducer TonB [Sphingobacterium faecale]MBL1411305.1 energy transducer TonB [Sphingobacterium faecale]
MKHTIFSISKYLVVLFFLGLTNQLQAQETIVTYIKKDGGFTPLQDSAAYTSIVHLQPNEAGLYQLREYYPNGNLKRRGWVKAADPKRLRFEGLVEDFYDNEILKSTYQYSNDRLLDTAKKYYRNGGLKETIVHLKPTTPPTDLSPRDLSGRLVYYADSLGHVQVSNGNGIATIIRDETKKEQGEYINGLREGHWTGFLHNGKSQFEEWYNNGILEKGVTTDSLGQQHKYTQKDVEPEYPGGIMQLRMFIGNNYRYPAEAIKANVSGQLLISFVVEKTGKTSEHKIINDLGYGTGQRAIEVLKRAKDWTPGYHRGLPVRVAYSVPIQLNLN